MLPYFSLFTCLQLEMLWCYLSNRWQDRDVYQTNNLGSVGSFFLSLCLVATTFPSSFFLSLCLSFCLCLLDTGQSLISSSPQTLKGLGPRKLRHHYVTMCDILINCKFVVNTICTTNTCIIYIYIVETFFCRGVLS